MDKKGTKETIYLSASKIDTLKTCTWLYHCSYVLKLPDRGNSGAKRGTACHDLLECLCNPRHADILNKLEYVAAVDEIPAIKRFLQRKFKALDLDPNEEVKRVKGERGTLINWTSVLGMLKTALQHEFFDNAKKGKKIIHAELKFDHVNENPRYAVRGFIDRVAVCDDGKTLEILDYKSSKAKFDGEKKTQNIQGMIYTLMARKLWKDYDRYIANFFFMRFPSDPYQYHEYSEEELKGLEAYLEYITGILEKFDYKMAVSDMANKHREKSWLCGRGSWQCPFKKPFMFFAIIDESGKHVTSTFTYGEAEKYVEGIKNQKNMSIEIRQYAGCPAWKVVDNQDNVM